jgi:hypothetical protein
MFPVVVYVLAIIASTGHLDLHRSRAIRKGASSDFIFSTENLSWPMRPVAAIHEKRFSVGAQTSAKLITTGDMLNLRFVSAPAVNINRIICFRRSVECHKPI